MNCWLCANAADAAMTSARPSQACLTNFMVFLLGKIPVANQPVDELAKHRGDAGPCQWAPRAATRSCNIHFSCCDASMRKRPQPELFLGDLPKPCQTVRFDDEEKYDQAAKDHQFKIRRHAAGDAEMKCLVEEGHAGAQEYGQHR